MDDSEAKQAIVDFIKKKTARGKGMSNYRDITKGLPEIDRKLIKKLTQDLIEENVLDYWSSGSTTYITLKGFQPGSGETPPEEGAE